MVCDNILRLWTDTAASGWLTLEREIERRSRKQKPVDLTWFEKIVRIGVFKNACASTNGAELKV